MKIQYINVNGLDDAIVIEYYENLKLKLNSIIYYLRKSVSALNNFDADLSEYYTIDDAKVNNVNFEALKDELNSKLTNLENVIIPSIDSKISSIKSAAAKIEKRVVESSDNSDSYSGENMKPTNKSTSKNDNSDFKKHRDRPPLNSRNHQF